MEGLRVKIVPQLSGEFWNAPAAPGHVRPQVEGDAPEYRGRVAGDRHAGAALVS
jgi:hypothetical protein